MNFDSVIVIPARQGSTRFPGKPLAMIHGRQLLLRTWLIAKAVGNVDEVFVATDDEGIATFSRSIGAKVLMTKANCSNGSERVYDAVKSLPQHPRVAINLQGDAVLTPPWVIQDVVEAMKRDPLIQIATPATRMNWAQYDLFIKSKEGGRISGTTVVFDYQGRALYFSKAVIPTMRDRSAKIPPIYRHIGLYGYRFDVLQKYVSLVPPEIEEAEKLEQLRALYNGIPIQVVPVDYRGRSHWSVDNPEDIGIVEGIIEQEGELV